MPSESLSGLLTNHCVASNHKNQNPAARPGEWRITEMNYKNNTTRKPNKQEGIPIYSGQRVIGSVRNQVFRKVITGSKHLLRQPPAIAISLDALQGAVRAGAKQLEVYDRETKTTYRATIKQFLEGGFTFNRGFGEQMALPLDGWTCTKKGGNLPIQTALFRGI